MRGLVRVWLLTTTIHLTAQDPSVVLDAGPATCGAAGDFDGDGDSDLVIGQEDRPLVLLVNDGKGAFTRRDAAFATAEPHIRALAVFDADGDADLDILVGGENTLTRLWVNDGALRFVDASARLPEAKLWVTAIVTADLDGDGDIDVVLANFAGPSVVFHNEGPRFVQHDDALPSGVRTVTALALADLDSDQDLDLVLGQSPDALRRGGRNRAARNDGHGKFGDATEAWMPTATRRTTALALADLDGDGALDLVCAHRGDKPKEGARSSVHRRGSGGRFLTSALSRYGGDPAVSQAVALGDVDGDRDIDILFGNDGAEALYLNDGGGVFQASAAVPRHDDDTRVVLLVDVDGDGDLDIVTINYGAPARLFVNAGAGQFGRTSTTPTADDGGSAPSKGRDAAVAAGKYATRAKARATVSATGPRNAINAALRFLADHQTDSGAFRAGTFVGGEFDDPPVPPTHDIGVTGLALLCFLAEASHPHGGFHADTVQRGVTWLVDQQQENGWIGPPDAQHGIYDHAIATLVLAEARALSGDTDLDQPLHEALTLLESRRNPDGGFRYEPAVAPSDTSVTAWCALAQIAGNDVGIAMAPGATARTIAYLRAMTDAVTGRTGYSERGGLSSRVAGETELKYPAEKTEAMTGAALFVRLAMGDDPATQEDMRHGLARVAAALPAREPTGYFDPYAWFHVAHALVQLGGDEWFKWRAALHEILVPRQRTTGKLIGSWDPREPWGAAGGRFVTTALATLTLQAEYRFAPLIEPTWRRRIR